MGNSYNRRERDMDFRAKPAAPPMLARWTIAPRSVTREGALPGPCGASAYNLSSTVALAGESSAVAVSPPLRTIRMHRCDGSTAKNKR